LVRNPQIYEHAHSIWGRPGFFSIFNAAAMKRVELIKGGIPARYGGRLSSVINYTMKEGNLKRFAGEGAIGLISSRAMLEGPIVKDRASFVAAGRRTYADQLWRPFLRGRKRFGAAFHDVNFKANYILTTRDRVYLSGYTGRDSFLYQEKSVPGTDAGRQFTYELGWRNRLASARWNRVVGDRLFVNTLVGVTQYAFASRSQSRDTDYGGHLLEFEQSWQSDILDWTAKVDLEYAPNPRHSLRFGVESITHRFSPGSTKTRLDEFGRQAVNEERAPTGILRSQEIALYAEDEVQLRRALRMLAGIRASHYAGRNHRFGSIEPRVGINVRLAERTAFKASFSRSKQYVHLLTGGGVALPTDLWIPTMDGIGPQSGFQVAAGIFQAFREGRYEVTVEGYLKKMKGHIDYRLGADNSRSAFLDWPDLVETGAGTSRGAEVFAQKKHGHLTGWIGYTWARSTRKFKGLNGGQPFADGYDRRHDASIVIQYKVSETKQISAAWVYGSGYPVWVPVGRYVGSGGFGLRSDFRYPHHVVHTGPVNTARAPSYHRLDVSVHFRKQRSWAERTISLGIYNAYNRKNPMFVYPKRVIDGQSLIGFRQLSLLQLIPAVSIQWRF
ncbi:MAG: TonB-dependent receptor, partial [Bacteroidota bacterium]|nr:TonB-dependent receptor [Bacteroidota bacterium]